MGTGDLTCIILAVEMSGNKTLKGGVISDGFFNLVPPPKNEPNPQFIPRLMYISWISWKEQEFKVVTIGSF